MFGAVTSIAVVVVVVKQVRMYVLAGRCGNNEGCVEFFVEFFILAGSSAMRQRRRRSRNRFGEWVFWVHGLPVDDGFASG